VLDWVDLFVNGYKRVGKLDIGPISGLYAHNDFEGSRFRIGFRTTPLISRDWLTQAYLVYGTQDNRFKYGLRQSFIAERRHWTVFSAEYKHDVEQSALLDNDFLDNNNLFATASRWGRWKQQFTTDGKPLTGGPVLRDLASLSVQRDLFHGFTETLTARYQSIFRLYERPGTMPENVMPRPNPLHLSELVFESRYAPDETFVQSENRRRAVGLKRLPVFGFRYTLGMLSRNKSVTYHKFNLSVTHSVSVGYLGRLNYRVEGNYIPTALPSLILKAPLGNQTPFYNANAFNLMNYFEFVTDRSVSLRLDQHFEGLLLNAIPGLRKLNWRLVGTANILYGELSKNARDANGNAPELGNIHEPYMEAGYGVENIFKFLRVDFIHRLTYRDQPNVIDAQQQEHQNFGVKFSAQFRL
jgi:Family of unknown function (DUF5686)